ncbi:hypothetical protein F5Y04DRAFT_164106 [Hypomontagnella monticulosa]|nr:hypothetical protein F5Y04DRAFT_164106 [Hypomontagnella monticulosa]
MEVIGTVAATTQLIGTAIGILDSIAQLRDFLQHAPARYQGWRDDLAVLSDTISDIQLNPALHTRQIGRIIDTMEPKIKSLTGLCSCYTSGSKGSELKFITKLNRALSARATESRILRSFESLEHDKTTLILTISTLDRSAPVPSPTQKGRDTFTTTQSVEDKMDNSNNTELVSNHSQHGAAFTAQRIAEIMEWIQHRLIQSLQARDASYFTDSDGRGEPSVTPQNHRPIPQGQQSNFTNYTAIGDDCLCGDTTGSGINMNNACIISSRSAHGTHTETAIHYMFYRRFRSFWGHH